ncbi:RNA polymerase sigma factor [Granulosicoccus sp. 3-233]|uniref:RNA polymerase sigma factor n=1 Tax=Granulosicoccus sp. 3-233 TaxID=3417969 RepID=UPI003D352A09
MEIQSTQPHYESDCDDQASCGSRHDLTPALPDACQNDKSSTIDSTRTSDWQTEPPAAISLSIADFLQSVERKAFVMARYALQNEDDALDTVQDAMLKLCERYADRPPEEWPPLYYRILQNGITDRRRPRGMQRLKRWIQRSTESSSESTPDESMLDTMDCLPSDEPGPQDTLSSSQNTSRINRFLTELPARQREVFLLRNWQGLSVKETAEVMNISDGSVKTHLSRAVAALRERLDEQEQ